MERYNYKLPDISKMLIGDRFYFGKIEYIICTDRKGIKIMREFDFKNSRVL